MVEALDTCIYREYYGVERVVCPHVMSDFVVSPGALQSGYKKSRINS
jgi:hypothetical protein